MAISWEGKRFSIIWGLLLAGKWRQVWDELQARRQRRGLALGRVIQRQLLMPFLASLWPIDRASWLRRQVSRIRQNAKPPSYPAWIRPEFAQRVGLDDIALRPVSLGRGRDVARRQRYNTVFTPLHMRGVVWSERTQARFGLGFADPWSDRRIASYVLAIPQWVIQGVREPKRMVRQAMRGIVPEEVRQAMRKIVPYPLYERALKQLARETIFGLLSESQAAARGYIDPDILRHHYEAFLDGQQSARFLWATLSLEMWLRQQESSYTAT